jgi:hypothetical protein
VSAGPAIIGNPSNPVTGGTGTAAGAAANLVPGWKGIQDIGAWLSSGAHWKGIGLVAGAVALAGVGLVIVLAGNKDVRRTAEAAAL